MARINNINKATNNHGISKAISNGNHIRGKLTVCYETRQFCESAVMMAEMLGVPYWSLVAHLEGKQESVSGYHCRYVEDTAAVSAFYSERRKADIEAQKLAAQRKEIEAEIARDDEEIKQAKELLLRVEARRKENANKLKALH